MLALQRGNEGFSRATVMQQDLKSKVLARLDAHMSKHRLKPSRQRTLIVELLLTTDRHLSVDEILTEARKRDRRVSQATVYRTVKLLEECHLLEPQNFRDGVTRYELAELTEHHDHLICTGCGRIIEFVHPRIERLQEEVAKKHGFLVTHHKMELYGTCAACRSR